MKLSENALIIVNRGGIDEIVVIFVFFFNCCKKIEFWGGKGQVSLLLQTFGFSR